MGQVALNDQSRAAARNYDNASPVDPQPTVYDDLDTVVTQLTDANVPEWLADIIGDHLCGNGDDAYFIRQISRHCRPIVERAS